MLPTVSKGRSSSSTSRTNPMFVQYLRRIIKWQQMDIEYTFWQMLHLCTSPKVVGIYNFVFCMWNYGNAMNEAISTLNITNSNSYVNRLDVYLIGIHFLLVSETKNQWARDDPAFVVICSLLLAVATLAYCVAYDHSTAHAVFVVISVLLFHFLVTGMLLATFCWFLTNAYLREEAPNSHVVEQRVEWQVLNLLFATLLQSDSNLTVYLVIHYFLSPLLVAHGFIPVLLSNLLFMVAASYYHYLNFLGYDGKLKALLVTDKFLLNTGPDEPALNCIDELIQTFCLLASVLPFLERTTFFLYPIGAVIVLSPIFILSGFNPSRYFMNMYFGHRVYFTRT
ncbi:hypothetical protein FEM48_Zijuj09G0128400 [Ziziphus jujuba var. spinosa]|uniref:Protein unc-50 homolog n=1 Tax=Ziziphus jujuba var. spinosa TaxID=714518 RepID=A0A978UT40_ZIZJJ|nr:hypothetical protein FEM48_Zijuj09G0128400 [Ziziphus jujuba var. spinosa]